MHPVFGLVEHDGAGALKHLVGDLHGREAVLLVDLPADAGVQVVEGGQAVHEHGVLAGGVHQLLIDLIGLQVRDALGPDGVWLAHGHPHVRVEHVRPLDGLHRVLDEAQGRAALLRESPALLHQRVVGEVFLRGAGYEVHAHLGAAHHQAVAHVVAGIAQVDQLHALQRAEPLFYGEEVRQDLGGVELVG